MGSNLQYLKEGWRPHGPGRCRCPKCGTVTSTNALARSKHTCKLEKKNQHGLEPRGVPSEFSDLKQEQ